MTKNETYFDDDKKKAPLPLTFDTKKKKTQKTLTFKLRTVPTDHTSSLYEYQMDLLDGTEEPREVIQWYHDIVKVLKGLNITDGTNQSSLITETLRGKPKSAFTASIKAQQHRAHERAIAAATNAAKTAFNNAQRQAQQNGAAAPAPVDENAIRNGTAVPDIHADWIIPACQAVLSNVIPRKALQRQKRCMRRYWRKPRDMTVKQYAANLVHINETELPLMPPFVQGQELAEDEIIDIIMFGTPKGWSRELDKQGYNAETMTLQHLTETFTRFEESEDFDSESKPIPKKAKKDGKNKDKLVSGKKDCMFHGPNTHPTEACKTIQAMVTSTKKGSTSGSGKPPFKNKTWKKSDGGKDTKKEMKAFVADTIRKELHALSKKRKADDDDEVNMMDIDFDKFNYKDDKSDDKSEGEVSI